MVKPAFEAALRAVRLWQQLQKEFNVGKAVPGRRKCSKFQIPLLTANAVALSEAMHMAYDINSLGLPFKGGLSFCSLWLRQGGQKDAACKLHMQQHQNLS